MLDELDKVHNRLLSYTVYAIKESFWLLKGISVIISILNSEYLTSIYS